MYEYTILYKEGLTTGLRASDHNPKNKGALIQADGVIKESGELFNLDELSTFDVSTIEACTLPFPQFIDLRKFILVCTPTKIYTYDGSSLTLVYTATGGSTWTVGDFYRFLVLSNGNEFITLDPETADWAQFSDCEFTECLCVCDVNGQLFVGGPGVSVSIGWLGE